MPILTPDPAAPAFKAPVGSHLSLSIEGSDGMAMIIGADYAGKAVPAPVNPVKFDVVADAQILRMVVENDTPADLTKLICDSDGTTLHEFVFDPVGGPVSYTIRGV